MSRIKEDDRGLSLIEVLVAMMILAIVVTPFLHSFFTTANTNNKAKKMHRATTLAQSVMEGLKGESLEEISAQFNYPALNWTITDSSQVTSVGEYRLDGGLYYPVQKYDPASGLTDKAAVAAAAYPTSTYSEDNGATFELLKNSEKKYYFIMDDVKLDKGVYDVLVTMDATTANATHYNNADMTQLPIVNLDQDAMCMESPDYLDMGILASDVGGDIHKMRRTITITVTRNTVIGSSEDVYKVTVNYHYANIFEPSKSYDKPVTAFNSSETGQPLRNIYLYYTPIYPTAKLYDTIEYVNDSNVPVDLYIFKQNYSDISQVSATQQGAGLGITTDALETGYRMTLKLSSAGTSYADFATNLRTNIFKNTQSGGALPSTNFDMKYNNTNQDLSGADVTETDTGERVYEFEVKVYSSDAFTPGGGSGGVALDASKELTSLKGNILD